MNPLRRTGARAASGVAVLLALSGCGGGDPRPSYREPATCLSPSPIPAERTLELGTGAADGVCALAEGDAVPIVTGGQGAEMFVLALRVRAAPGSCLHACARDCSRCAECYEASVECGISRRFDLGCPTSRGEVVEAHDLTMPFGTPDPPAEIDCVAKLDVATEGLHLETRRRLHLAR